MALQSMDEFSTGAPELELFGRMGVSWVEVDSLVVVPGGVVPNLSSRVQKRVVKRASIASTLTASVDTISRRCWSRVVLSAEDWSRTGVWAGPMPGVGVVGCALDTMGEREWDCNGGKCGEAGPSVTQALWSGGGAG